MQNARTFLRQERLKPNRTLRLEDIVTPGQEDVAQDYASDMGMQQPGGFQPPQQGMPYVTPDEQPEAEAPPVEAVGFNDATTKSEPPNNHRRALAQSLLEQGSQPFKSGAGWWGVADRLAATGVGAWMDSRETEREDATKKTALNDFLSSLDETDPVHKYAKSVALSGDVTKATDLILRHETQKQIAAMKAKNTGTGYKQRTYNKAGREITEQSNDGGTTWQPLSQDARYKPEDQNELLTPETRDFMAEQYIGGDKSVFLRLPQKEAAALRNTIVAKIKTMKNPDGSPISARQVNAAIRELDATGKGLGALATRTANIDTAAQEANQMATLAEQANLSIPRGQFVPVNKIMQNIELAMSNPKLSQFAMYTTAVASAMATVAGRGTTNQFLQEKFMHMLTTANSPEAYAAQMKAIRAEVQAVVNSTGDVREHMIDTYTRGAGSIGAPDGSHSAAPAAGDTTEYDYGTNKKNNRKVRRKKGSKDWEYY